MSNNIKTINVKYMGFFSHLANNEEYVGKYIQIVLDTVELKKKYKGNISNFVKTCQMLYRVEKSLKGSKIKGIKIYRTGKNNKNVQISTGSNFKGLKDFMLRLVVDSDNIIRIPVDTYNYNGKEYVDDAKLKQYLTCLSDIMLTKAEQSFVPAFYQGDSNDIPWMSVDDVNNVYSNLSNEYRVNFTQYSLKSQFKKIVLVLDNPSKYALNVAIKFKGLNYARYNGESYDLINSNTVKSKGINLDYENSLLKLQEYLDNLVDKGSIYRLYSNELDNVFNTYINPNAVGKYVTYFRELYADALESENRTKIDKVIAVYGYENDALDTVLNILNDDLLYKSYNMDKIRELASGLNDVSFGKEMSDNDFKFFWDSNDCDEDYTDTTDDVAEISEDDNVIDYNNNCYKEALETIANLNFKFCYKLR